MKCRYCNSNTKVLIDLSDIQFALTSDCKVVNMALVIYQCLDCGLVQKDSTQKIQKNLFKNFHSHEATDGKEQIKFIEGIPYPRSKIIIDSISENINKNGKLLDIGTGSASFIKEFKKQFGSWELFGQDIQNNSEKYVLEVLNKSHYILDDISKISKKFDLVSLIHVLGHIPEIKEFMEKLLKLINSEGDLLIHSVDLEKSFFDIVVIDQINHFDLYTLYNILKRYFINVTYEDKVKAEITLLASNKNKSSLSVDKIDYDESVNIFYKIVHYLQNIEEKIVILGTTHPSTYCGLLLKDKLICFADEDKEKIGKKHCGKSIMALEFIDNDTIIFLPFFNLEIITSIKERHKNKKFINPYDLER